VLRSTAPAADLDVLLKSRGDRFPLFVKAVSGEAAGACGGWPSASVA